jgi:hypothetical protein
LAGSHRAARGGGRAAAREARRQKARKRNQTIAAGAAVVVLVGGGGVAALNAFGGDGSSSPKAGNGPTDDKPADSGAVLADNKALLDATGAKSLAATGAWAVGKTDDGSTAPDKSFVCQSQRLADPAGLRTWVRSFSNATTKDTAVQYVEVSNDKTAAAKTYSTIVGWLGQCSVAQTRLTAGYVTTGVGGAPGWIAVFAQQSGAKTRYKTISVTLAGQATMLLEHDTAAAPKSPQPVLAASAAGVKKICGETGGCGTGAPLAKPSLPPTTDSPGFLAPVDLPVLAGVDKPWVGSPGATTAGTGCEKIDFKKAKAVKSGSLTYVTPGADVPTEFGLDDTVATFATQAAATAFVGQIRKNVDGCEKSLSNAAVDSTGTISTGSVKGKSWVASYDTGDGKKFKYRIGIAGSGNRAVYVVFPMLKGLDISTGAFNDTLVRAADRSATYK